jgi:hypothetical protein
MVEYDVGSADKVGFSRLISAGVIVSSDRVAAARAAIAVEPRSYWARAETTGPMRYIARAASFGEGSVLSGQLC